MVERVFLGWEQPFLEVLVDWLWDRRESLPGTLVVVPTAQSGRRLREALAERGGCLAPRVTTPGHFLKTDKAAPQSIEHLAWVEVIEAIEDWASYDAAFPIPPGEGEAAGWALGLASAMVTLRTSLQENALTIASAARMLSSTVEADRWAALAALESRVERLLAEWGWTSRSTLLARGSEEWSAGVSSVVLAGVPDLPAAAAQILCATALTITALVGAPETLADQFDSLGQPLDSWNTRPIIWPETGDVLLTADPRQQAAEAVRLAAAANTPSNALALGTADEETAGELVRAFGRAGWVLHDPSHLPPQALSAWLSAWRDFVRQPSAASAIDLLAFPQSSPLVKHQRAQRAKALSEARDRWLAKDAADLDRALAQTRRDAETESLKLAIDTLESLSDWRERFFRAGFHRGLEAILEAIDPGQKNTTAIIDWLQVTSDTAARVRRGPGFWIDLLLGSLPESVAIPPEGRVLDVQGWLELFHEPGHHLIVCGMNEGKVPGRASSDAWLPETARGKLGLSSDATRAARDAYLLTAMLEARRNTGRVDLLLAKTGADGAALLPSRLLLAAPEPELPARVTTLFRELEPPDAALAWTLDESWKWKPRVVPMKPRLGVTAFADYLSCPFRFYLKHVTGMGAPEPERVEWNARDFGNIAHIVLENWALDSEACAFSTFEAIEEWVHTNLNEVVRERFGTRPPLAVRIQTESMRQRLSWFARIQAAECAKGWRVTEVEKKFEIQIDEFIVVGRVDRIERHDDGRRRVLDYKTGNVGPVESAHRVAITANTRLPAHLENVPAILHTTADGKTKRWKNLQLALYSAALGDIDEIGYFSLGAMEGDVKLSLWEGFSPDDRDSALECAKWVISRVKQRTFWPPAEKVDWDDYEILSLGRSLEETVAFEGGAA